MSGVGRKSWAQDIDNRSQKNVQNQNKVAVKPIYPLRIPSRSCTRPGATLRETKCPTQSPKHRLYPRRYCQQAKAHKYCTTHIKTPPLRTSTRGKCGRYGHLRATAKPLHLIGREARMPRDERARWQIVVAVVDRLLKGIHPLVRALCFL